MTTKDRLNLFYLLEGVRFKDGYQDQLYGKFAAKHTLERKKEIQTLIKPYIRGNCLEIGCAEGMYCKYIKDCGAHSVVGIDCSYPKINRALERYKGIENLTFIQMDWDKLDNEYQFDLILATEVLEHSLNPIKLLKMLLDISKFLFITVPINENYLDTDLKISGHINLFRETDQEVILKNGLRKKAIGLDALYKENQIINKITTLYGYVIFKGNLK